MDASFSIVSLPPVPPVSPGTAPVHNPDSPARAAQGATPQPQTPIVPGSEAALAALKELAAMQAAPTQSVNAALQAAAANQGGLSQLMADLVQAQRTPGLPAPVQAAIAQILALNTPLDGQVSGGDIKAALTKSGLFPEANAAADLRASTAAHAGAQPLPAPTDIKTALLVLQQVLKNWLGNVPAPPPAPAGAKEAAPEPARSPTNNPPPPYRGGPAASAQPQTAPGAAPTVSPGASPHAAAKPAQGASTPPQAQIVPSPQAMPAAPQQVPAAAAPVVPQSATTPPGPQVPQTGADIKTAPPVPPQLSKASLADAPAQPHALEAEDGGVPSPLRSPANNSQAPAYRAPTGAQSTAAPVPAAPGFAGMSPEAAAKAAQPASQQAQIAPSPGARPDALQLPTAEKAAGVPQQAAPAAATPTQAALPAGADLKIALVVMQQLLKTSLGAAAPAYALAAETEAAPEALRPPPPVNNPPPPYRGGPTSAQPPLPPTPFADANPRLVGQVLLSHAEAALSHMKLLQIASLPDAPSGTPHSENQGSRWMFEIPFATPQGSAVAQFEISRDAGRDAEEPSSGAVWRARFSLDVEPVGPVHAQIALMGERAWVTLWAEREESVQTLRAQEGLLNQALKESDFVAEVAFCLGAPRRRAAASGQFLDSAS